MNNGNLILVGKFKKTFADILGIKLKPLKIYRSKGLPKHLLTHDHFECLGYIDYVPDIIENPDYIGINPNENGISVEYVKVYSENVQIGIKLDSSGEYLYVSTMYMLQDSKLNRRVYSGRLKKITD